MSHILALGAINKVTREYVFPKIANKRDEYICPECNKDLIVCQGTIKVHHFRHTVDHENPCQHYSHPSESQIHKDAKLLMKNLLERKIPVSFIRKCISCEELEEYEISEMLDTSNINLEYRFEHNGPKIADVAYVDGDEIICIIEICNTHRTCSENRPEPWFEIDATKLINIANNNKIDNIQIPCIRREKCEDCIKLEQIKSLKYIDIDRYIRTILGDDYPIPKYKSEYYDSKGNLCLVNISNKCLLKELLYDTILKYKFYFRSDHLRLNFDACNDQKEILKNKHIIELFNNDYKDKRVVIQSCKGSLNAFIVPLRLYNIYNYWEPKYYYIYGTFNLDSLILPYETCIEMSGLGTINIIKLLITFCDLSVKYFELTQCKYYTSDNLEKNIKKYLGKDIFSNSDNVGFSTNFCSVTDFI